MPELRKNIITREWVVIATERGKRPSDFKKATAAAKTDEQKAEEVKKCPFCPGNENQTPPEIFSYRLSGIAKNGAWEIRAIPNKFAALQPDGNLDHKEVGIFDVLNGIGYSDVIIETPGHFERFPFLPKSHIEKVIKAYQERYLQLRDKPHVEHVIIFRNHGEKAGTSLQHPHSQIIATPVMPKEFWFEVEGAANYFEYEEKCAVCAVLDFESTAGDRVVWENDSFLAFTFFASRYPFETRIVPKAHKASFSDMTPYEGGDLAEIIKEVLSRLYNCLDDPSYNLTLHSLLKPGKYEESYHWHFQILPRLTTPAGFELGTGMFINVTAPEEAAKFLREAKSFADIAG
ncbi:MAG: galactose-1-phosphate uridylyltransferase [Firmicutes bacterium]|nr:galactose-1-phosphate uridylyltransferase [Bacillota bacterium]